MATVHFLNVGQGDCTAIQHNSGRLTVVDICKGNYELPKAATASELLQTALEEAEERWKGNFGMSKKPTNPINYLKGLGIESVFRFILTHPDMDHLDGFDAFMNAFSVQNYWDSGVRKEKPDFEECFQYDEADWDRYAKVLEGKEPNLRVKQRLAGDRFAYANKADGPNSGNDGLYILAPDKELVQTALDCGDCNDASYVLLYRSNGGRIVIPGDAHDETWDYVIEHYKKDVENCSVLFAPHHGRKSGRNFSFLDTLKPKITFFGCASSGHLAYSAWSSRKLPVITNNQAGNIVLECGNGSVDIYVQNSAFAKSTGRDVNRKNNQGYTFFDTISETEEVKT